MICLFQAIVYILIDIYGYYWIFIDSAGLLGVVLGIHGKTAVLNSQTVIKFSVFCSSFLTSNSCSVTASIIMERQAVRF